jgi:hypothetical protein
MLLSHILPSLGNCRWQGYGPPPAVVVIHFHRIFTRLYPQSTFRIIFWIFTLLMCTQPFPSSTKVLFWPSTIQGAVYSKCAFSVWLIQFVGSFSKDMTSIHKSQLELLTCNGGSSARLPSPDASADGTPRPDPSQEVTPLLLLSIFAITARFCEDGVPPPPRGEMWGAGCDYLDSARAILCW